MGKRIITQRRGRGTNTYKAKSKSYRYKLQYPRGLSGEATVKRLFNSSAHTAPLAEIKSSQGNFYIPAFEKMVEGQKINFNKVENGSILMLKDIPVKTNVYCIESKPGDGGTFIKTGGSCATVTKLIGGKVVLLMPSKKEKRFNPNCRAIVGVIAGAGRLDKPFMKAGKKFYIKKAKNKLWPRTGAFKMNAIDHPFGSGRGKNPKSKTVKRNAPRGRRVGLIRPKRTGKRK